MRGSDSEVGGEDGGGVVGVVAMAEAPSAARARHISRRPHVDAPKAPPALVSAIGTDFGATEPFKQSISQERPLLIIFDILPLNNNNT